MREKIKAMCFYKECTIVLLTCELEGFSVIAAVQAFVFRNNWLYSHVPCINIYSVVLDERLAVLSPVSIHHSAVSSLARQARSLRVPVVLYNYNPDDCSALPSSCTFRSARSHWIRQAYQIEQQEPSEKHRCHLLIVAFWTQSLFFYTAM